MQPATLPFGIINQILNEMKWVYIATVTILTGLWGCPGPPDPGNHLAGGVKAADVSAAEDSGSCSGAEIEVCELQWATDYLDFGKHHPGDVQWGELRVKNVGTGVCMLEEWALSPCIFQDNTFNCQDGAMSAFTVVQAPEPNEALAPGQSMNFSIYFEAPTENAQNLMALKHYGRLGVFFADPCDPSALKSPVPAVEQGINIMASVDGAYATVAPTGLDFGVVRDDCPVETRAIHIKNAGPTAFNLTSIQLNDCPQSIVLTSPKPLPTQIDGFQQLVLITSFEASGDEDIACELVVNTDAPNLTETVLSIRGRSTATSKQTDVFVQGAKPKLDILFVVDNSNSMKDEQDVLALGLPTLVEKASLAGQVVQMAVTTTDAIVDSGVMVGEPPFVDGKAIDEFLNRLSSIGLEGDLNERGLEAAWLALSGANVAADGPNAGFLRPDAELAIIFVSDEDDHSLNDEETWVQRFGELKQLWTGVGVTVHSVVATSNDCSDLATIGSRYIAVSQAYSGQVVNICSPDFAEKFSLQGSLAFSVKDRFYPTYPPQPDTLQVRIDGSDCVEGWVWNPTAKALIFDSSSPCFPTGGAEVELDYQVACPTGN